MPCLSHGIENLVQDWFTTLGAFRCIFILIAFLAPGILITYNERCGRSKWLPLTQEPKYTEQVCLTSPHPAQKKWPIINIPILLMYEWRCTGMIFIPQGRDDFILNGCITVFTPR